MKRNEFYILSTRPLGDALPPLPGQTTGIRIDEIPFIATRPADTQAVRGEVLQQLQLSLTVVFTSMNAVDAVAEIKGDVRPEWTIYCMGHATRQLVEKHFGADRIAGTASDAADLARLMIKKGNIGEVSFFCGDQRRDELPDILKRGGIEVHEIVVYHTVETPARLEMPYHGILFFSPSAVRSFFRINTVPEHTILFAIGNTTAAEIRKYSVNTIMTATEPGKDNLVRQAVAYFSSLPEDGPVHE
jgi:uroporphyrinogen-III synthase